MLLGALWFFALGSVGAFAPYYSLYLHENAGLTGSQVGAVYSILPLVGIAAQPFWGQVADRTGARARVLCAIALGATFGYCSLYFWSGFTALLLATAVLAWFSRALIPSCVVVTLALTRDAGRHAFGLARAWGTVGYLTLVVALPFLLDWSQQSRGLTASPDGPSEPGLELMFLVAAVFALISGLVALRLPRTAGVGARAARGDWRQLFRHGPYVRMLAFALLAYLFLQGPLGLFPLYVRSHGGTLDMISRMWIPMLLLEIPLVALSGASLARVGARGLLAIGVLACGVRWLLCAVLSDLSWIFAAQLLHGVTVAGLVIGAPLYVEAVVPAHLRSTGQGVLAMLGVGVGGACSYNGAGWLVEHVGPTAPYWTGGAGALALVALLPALIPRPQPVTAPSR